MGHEIRKVYDGWVGFSMTIAALASGAARQSTMLSNTLSRPGASIMMSLKSGAVAPTAGAIYEFFLLRGNSSGFRTDNAGSSNAAITILNAPLIGSLQVTATAAAQFADEFDTAPLGNLGPEWGVATRNSSGQALDNTEANHVKQYNLYVPNFQ